MSSISAVLQPGERPGTNDCICGRGGLSNGHNVKFRAFIDRHRPLYLAATRTMKPRVSTYVVSLWRTTQNPPGRFLDKKIIKGADGTVVTRWFDVGDHAAARKVSQCLRARRKNRLFTVTSDGAKQEQPGGSDSLISLLPQFGPVERKDCVRSAECDHKCGQTLTKAPSSHQDDVAATCTAAQPKSGPILEALDHCFDEDDTLAQMALETDTGVSAEDILAQMIPCAAKVTENVFESDDVLPCHHCHAPVYDEEDLDCEFPSIPWAVFGQGEPLPLLGCDEGNTSPLEEAESVKQGVYYHAVSSDESTV